VAAQEPSGAVDFGYLEGFAAGDVGVVAEVLDLFLQQAAGWVGALDQDGQAWADTVHTIKGAARGIGANALGDVCARAEAAGPGATPAVQASLAEAVAEISAYRARR
jgi:HPt (histidine-containing phosphotransfer) domain-containing protein